VTTAAPSKPADLTERQREILAFLWESTCRDGFQPDIRTIAEHFGFSSTNGVVCHLRALQRKAWIDMGHNQSRAIRFLRTPAGDKFLGFRPITGDDDR
jgi:repressor LexA